MEFPQIQQDILIVIRKKGDKLHTLMEVVINLKKKKSFTQAIIFTIL